MIKLRIDGEPVAASRPRVTRKGWAYIAPKYKAYKDNAHLTVRKQYKGEPLMGALKVKTTFYRSVQKSVSKAGHR